MVEKEEEIKVITSELVRRINEDGRRIRLLEQRLEAIDESVTNVEETTLSQMDDLKIGIERVVNKIMNILEKLNGIENEITNIDKKLNKSATKAELKQLETFVDVLNPIKSKFVTKDEMERMLEYRGGSKKT
jgi:hypothetical protein